MNTLRDQIIEKVVLMMAPTLEPNQIALLKWTLTSQLGDCTVEKITTEPWDEHANKEIVSKFLKAKEVTGRLSEKSRRGYSYRLIDFIDYIGKNINEIQPEDIRNYFEKCLTNPNGQKKKNSSMNNIYHIINSFFTWVHDNEYISKNPMKKVCCYKVKKTVKTPFTEEEISKLKDNCSCIRDLAIIDLLNSSMIRVGELVRLNIDDISFEKKEFVVFGKGDQERVSRFDGQTKHHLLQYLNSRKDNEEALFISERGTRRLGARGVETMLAKVGERAGISDVHPHRFRRTGATRCLRANIPLDAIQHMLGHSSISTTQIYAMSNESTVNHYYHQVYNE